MELGRQWAWQISQALLEIWDFPPPSPPACHLCKHVEETACLHAFPTLPSQDSFGSLSLKTVKTEQALYRCVSVSSGKERKKRKEKEEAWSGPIFHLLPACHHTPCPHFPCLPSMHCHCTHAHALCTHTLLCPTHTHTHTHTPPAPTAHTPSFPLPPVTI